MDVVQLPSSIRYYWVCEMEKKDNKKIYIKQMVCAFFFTLAIALLCFPSRFQLPAEETTLRIEATARKNRKSFGSDVRIQCLKLNGKEIAWDDMSWGEGWELSEADGIRYVINPQASTEVMLTAKNANRVQMEFYAQEGSGIVKIYANERKIGTVDLYSPVWKSVTFSSGLGIFLLLQDIFACFLIWAGCFGAIHLFCGLVLKQISKEELLTAVEWQSIVWIFLIIGSIRYRAPKAGIKMTVLCLGLLVVSWFVRGIRKYQNGLADGAAWGITTVIVFYCVEKVNGNLYKIESPYQLGNLAVYAAILLLFCLVCRKVKWGLAAGAVSLLIFGTANYYVVSFRGSPIVPGDFFALQTAATVMTNYSYTIEWNLYASVLLMIAWCIMLLKGSDEKKCLSLKKTLAGSAVWVGCTALIFYMPFFKPTMDLWNMNNSTSQYGLAVAMVSNIRRMRIAPPEGYSDAMAEMIAQSYLPEESGDGQKTNVIVIMNESFSDLNVLSGTLDSDVYMPYYNSLKENTVKGTALASTLGGGTANSEYEFLTGNTMAFMPGTVPYVQFILGKTDSMAQALKDMGYHTTAFHPYDIKNYKRYKVYPLMGFDTVFGMEEFTPTELERNLFITDEDSYKKVIEVFEEDQKQGNPSFIFNVTMQNHSSYTSGYYGDDCIRVAGMEGEYPEAEEYLTLIKKSDEALEGLIEYFRSVEEPTVICLFGDHLPKIEDRFYEAMIGKPMGEWSLEENQRRYEVPFFIWANYDIEEQENVVTSLNYLSGLLFQEAGLPMTGYQTYLKELSQEIPAMNVNGYLDADGIWHGYTNDAEEHPLIQEYENLQYYQVFTKKK